MTGDLGRVELVAEAICPRAATPERDCDVDITVRAHYNLGDEDEALERLAEVYEDVWRQIQWTREQG